MSTDTKKRVKLYILNEQRQWDDKGTGHVSSVFSDRLRSVSLVVKSELDGKSKNKKILKITPIKKFSQKNIPSKN